MFKKIGLTLSFLLALHFVHAQDQKPLLGCETPSIDSATFFSFPWFGNNQFLLDLVDSIHNVQGKPTGVTNTLFYVPVHAWIHLPTASASSNISKSTVETYINNVNDIMENTGSILRFYLSCEPFLITNSPYTNLNASNYNAMFDDYYLDNGLNIHFVVGGDAHRGRFPWESSLRPYACYIITNNNNMPYYVNVVSAVLCHEIGHAFGLLHTHEGSRGGYTYNRNCSKCYQEAVSRGKTQSVLCFSTMGQQTCSVNGDLLCDTDADPGQLDDNGDELNLSDCSYDLSNGGIYEKDRWSDIWLQSPLDNSTRNIMSYNHAADCRTELTPMQRGVELFYTLYRRILIWQMPNAATFFINPVIDQYENDNYRENATAITSGDCQEHSFHRVPLPNGDMSMSCDYDWLSFKPTSSGYYYFTTSGIQGMQNADTRLTLYAADGITILATNDNINATNHFSRALKYCTANSQYYIELEKAANFYSDDYYKICISQFHLPNPGQVQPFGNRFVLAPNPASSDVRVIAGENEHIGGIFIYDFNGSKKYEIIFNNDNVTEHTIDISSYLSGNYIVNVFNGQEWFGATLQKL